MNFFTVIMEKSPGRGSPNSLKFPVVDRLLSHMKAVQWLHLLLAAAPFLSYLLVFKYYAFLRDITGMTNRTPPNLDLLPAMELVVFHCLPHKLFAKLACIPLDLLAAVPYLIHFPLPVLFIVYLYLNPRRRRHIFPMLWCAGWVNFLAVLFQFTFPTAPPWFVDSAVFGENGNLVSVGNNEAGFERLDTLFGIKLFHSIYGASPVKFGAMPSLHVAWPAIILVCRPWFSTRFGVLHLVWISWAALYSNHHYGVDAIAGIALAFLVNLAMLKIYCPFKPVSMFLEDEEAFPRGEMVSKPSRSREPASPV